MPPAEGTVFAGVLSAASAARHRRGHALADVAGREGHLQTL